MPRKKTPSSDTANRPTARRISGLIEKKRINQVILAGALNIQRQTVSNYANGQSVPDAEMLKKIADYFGVSTDYLVEKSDVETPNVTVKEMCEYTGLSEKAVEALHDAKDEFPKHLINNQFLDQMQSMCQLLNWLALEEELMRKRKKSGIFGP